MFGTVFTSSCQNLGRGSCGHFSLPGTALLCGEAGAGAPSAALAARALKIARSITAARRSRFSSVPLPTVSSFPGRGTGERSAPTDAAPRPLASPTWYHPKPVSRYGVVYPGAGGASLGLVAPAAPSPSLPWRGARGAGARPPLPLFVCERGRERARAGPRHSAEEGAEQREAGERRGRAGGGSERAAGAGGRWSEERGAAAAAAAGRGLGWEGGRKGGRLWWRIMMAWCVGPLGGRER